MGLEYDDRDENFDWVERKSEERKNKIQLTTKQLEDSDFLILQLGEEDSVQTNSRCVSVDTNSITPDGRNEKKRVFKGKTELIKFRCTSLEKKLLKNRARRCGLTLSEYFRRVAFEKKITERLTEDEITIYRTLVKFHNNFKAIGNMYRKRNPHLTEKVYWLADEIKDHLQKFSP
ncbi:mobilization protein MbpA [uncultured Maribacter sp.]|uniref:mobilization protein MbpA n=1 Tax=uncultured Maribacter sp. TaxID=431308 RepID=UPI0026190CA1|nr:mobilization protein MbpA [uncultured Maribacter sp.]